MKHFGNIKNEGTKKEKVFISFYQFKNGLIQENIPTSSVCSEDYFYDQDGTIENLLAEMEKKWSIVLKNVADGQELTEDIIDTIKEFVAFQISRTKAMLLHSREMVSTIMGSTFEQEFGDDVKRDEMQNLLKKKVQDVITPEFCLRIVKEILADIDDLCLKIVNNETDVDFFTSDVPVVIINPIGVNSAGLGSVGEILFFPLSPRKMVILYDKKTYGELNNSISEIDDIDAFNKYQYISADERLLAKRMEAVNRLLRNAALQTQRDRFHQVRKTNTINDGGGTFFATKSRSIPYWQNISLFKIPKELRKIPIDFRETFPRKYSYDTRLAILCRVYRGPDFISKKELIDLVGSSNIYGYGIPAY